MKDQNKKIILDKETQRIVTIVEYLFYFFHQNCYIFLFWKNVSSSTFHKIIPSLRPYWEIS